MRLPGPIEERTRAGLPPFVVVAALVIVIGGGVFWLTTRDADSGAANEATGVTAASVAALPVSVDSVISSLAAPVRLLDTRSGESTVDGDFADIGTVAGGSTLELPVSGRASAGTESGLAALSITAIAGDEPSDVVVQPCGTDQVSPPSMSVPSGSTVSRRLLVPTGPDGSICLVPSAPVDLVVDIDSFVDQSAVRPFPSPVRIVDSTTTGSTADGKMAAIGVRPEQTTLRVPVSARFEGLGEAGAVMVSISAVNALEAGDVTVFAAEVSPPDEVMFDYEAETTAGTTAIVPIGRSGELCVSTTGRTDVVVDLLGLVPSSVIAPAAGTEAASCPAQTLFPDRRVVALYGTQRSERLGVLGEQDPTAAAERLDDVAEPWRAGDRPVLPAFELIATLATGTPEDRGVYNIRSSPDFVQEYLDAARRHGFYLILDLQTGQSDFLTEAKYYEDFLRQPDVGLALDPEWRTAPPDRPRGGFVGQVDAAEVNEVVDYLAQLVAEEGLPEKLLIVHQFQERMVTNRDQLREAPGVAVTIHMDGFGPRPEKLTSYDIVRAEPPFNMGLKLFYDEDTDLLTATDVLDAGTYVPVPDLITYQ